MSRFRHFPVDNFVERVDSLAIGIEGVHEMHATNLIYQPISI